MSSPEAISQGDAAARLGISRATVERWVNQGRLNTIRTGQRGGARRVLIDETFRAAQNASSKIPHTPPNKAAKSLTEQNPSPNSVPQIPHPHASHSRRPRAESLTNHDEAPGMAESATATSLAVDIEKSLAATTEPESLTNAETNLEPDATTVGQSNQRPSRHSFDGDLVPLTGPGVDAREAQSADPASARGQRERPRTWRARAAIAALLVVGVAGALEIYQLWQDSTPSAPSPVSRYARDRGGQARKLNEPARAASLTPATPRPRGGPARPSRVRAKTSPVADQPTRAAAAPPTNATTTPTDHPRAHGLITPCQSAGICVRT